MEVLKSWSILLGREGLAVLVKAGEFFTEQAASGEAKPEMPLFLPTGPAVCPRTPRTADE